MEKMVNVLGQFRGARVLITGNTGFKGSWLTEWLLMNGANVYGFALEPEWDESLFDLLRHGQRITHTTGDIRDSAQIFRAVEIAQPDWVFHLAAQPLVRRSYREPMLTWETNVLGTLNLLDAVYKRAEPQAVVIITTDKVYRNKGVLVRYKEGDELGGHDPYAASKAACELAASSWRESITRTKRTRLATARAGNVLGGGDWSQDRIVPDCFKAWKNGEKVHLRNPQAIRPWQHVLEPLSGYLKLATRIARNPDSPTAINFGPDTDAHISVGDLVERLALEAGEGRWTKETETKGENLPEERYLGLDNTLAREILGWTPNLSIGELIEWTAKGYMLSQNKSVGERGSYVQDQISAFEQKCAAKEL